MSAMSWVKNSVSDYVGNATANRDFRVQLRGSRSVVLFSLYLGVLILVATFVYWQTAGSDQMTIVDAQSKLQDFYQVVMILLAAVITLIAPGLTATSVVIERQRRSLDLVFSAPVSPKYYLVGKMISSYRYTWMLLVLSLPVTATCVVLGGASWTDVLVAYLLLSFHGMFLTAIGLLMSTLSQKPVSAIVWSYALTIAYLISTAAFGSVGAFSLSSSGGREVNFMVASNPFFVIQAADTYSVIAGLQVPNWILAGIVIGLFCKITLLCAGSLLAPYGGKELPSLRIHTLIYTFLLSTYICYAIGTSIYSSIHSMGGSSGSSGTDDSVLLGILLFWLMSPMFIFMPMLSCFGFDGEKRYWPNGLFKIRNMFSGTPSGALPFILSVILAAAIGQFVGAGISFSFVPNATYFAYFLLTASFWTFFWAAGRFVSSWFYGLKTSRTLQFGAFAVVVILPVPIFTVLAAPGGFAGPTTRAIWSFYVLSPLTTSTADHIVAALVESLIFLATSAVLIYVSEKKIANRVPSRDPSNEPNLSAA